MANVKLLVKVNLFLEMNTNAKLFATSMKHVKLTSSIQDLNIMLKKAIVSVKAIGKTYPKIDITKTTQQRRIVLTNVTKIKIVQRTALINKQQNAS